MQDYWSHASQAQLGLIRAPPVQPAGCLGDANEHARHEAARVDGLLQGNDNQVHTDCTNSVHVLPCSVMYM